MNKINKILIAIFGAVDVVVDMITPILLVLVFVNVFGFNGWGSYLLYTIGLLSGLFRGFKVGFLK